MNNKGTTLLIVILSILVIVAGGMLIYKIINEKEESENVVADDNVDINEDKDDKELVVEEKKPQIFNGNDRPIAVMIDNHSGAWPQANLNKAYLVYEIIVEGGETRLMAVFKGQDLEKIGPIRSSRHYFLDYALENDAIYVHHGWSPQAQNDISALNVNNINGIQESSNNFWRVKDKKSPHNMFTSTTSILKIAERKGYATISDKKSVLNYIASDVDLKEKYGIAEQQTENTSAESKAINATKIVIPHSTLQTVEYDYDENSKTKILDNVISLSTGRLKKYGNYDFLKSIQVITPTKKGELGTKELNKLLQEKINPYQEEKKEKKYGDIIFRENDRIMQIKNNYDIYWEKNNDEVEYGSGVFNGEFGTIIKINESEKQIKIKFDDEKVAWYQYTDLDQIEHAYAITVHKAQRK